MTLVALTLCPRETLVGFWATVTSNGSPFSAGPLFCLSCLSVCLSVYNVGVLWPNGWMDQDANRNEGPGDIVLDGDPAPATKRGTAAPTRGIVFVAL